MNNFYLTLPSNSSMNFFGNNTLTTKIQMPIQLKGKYDALTDLYYPYNWQLRPQAEYI
jgi:hypothetical protein